MIYNMPYTQQSSALTRWAKLVGIGVGLLGLLTASGTAAIKVSGVETVVSHEADIAEVRLETEAALAPMRRDMRYLTGMIECQYQQIAYEHCPAVIGKFQGGGFQR